MFHRSGIPERIAMEKGSPTSKMESERRKGSVAADTGWKVPSIFSNQHSIATIYAKDRPHSREGNQTEG